MLLAEVAAAADKPEVRRLTEFVYPDGVTLAEPAKIGEALAAHLQSLQIVFNILRQRPIEHLFPRALERKVGILARLPLSSGMLTGKLTAATQFHADDHRSFNREGAAFSKGETFSGFLTTMVRESCSKATRMP